MRNAALETLAFSFGPFRLLPERQLLMEGEEPVRLGSRAFELLHALVEHPGELVSKDDLIARIWPHTSVAESNLKVQVAALRRALGDGRDGRRYVATANGRGYRFVGLVERSGTASTMVEAAAPSHNLVPDRTCPLGRDDVVETITRELPLRRLITVVGPGGIGKTTVAVAAASALIGRYPDGVWLVELAGLRDPELVPSAIATALGVRTFADGGAKALAQILRTKAMLIVLDCCEHVLDASATIADELVRHAPALNIIATSREPLRTKEEVVLRLGPLAVPSGASAMTAAEASRFPAVQLFVERAVGAQQGFTLTDENAGIVGEICRRLDGIALAIELAARRTDAFAPRELLSLLLDRFGLLTQGLRTELPHHRTLAAAIDWSYDLLAEQERVVLRSLSVFAASFDLAAATAVAGAKEPPVAIATIVGDLVAKSLVQAESAGAGVRYRLLDTMRAYARAKLVASGELPTLLRRHAHYCWSLFGGAESESEARPTDVWLADYGRSLDDVRAALDWSFSADGDLELGAGLTAVAVPLWVRLSNVAECRDAAERALDAAWDRSLDGGRVEMKLAAALGSCLLQTGGPADRGREAWQTAADIADRLADGRRLVEALWGLCDYSTWRGEHRAALRLAERIRKVATATGDEAARINVGRQFGTALRYLGELQEARSQIDELLARYVAPSYGTHAVRFQLDPRIAARGTLANVLWLQGFPDQAVDLSRQALADAKATGHALALCNAFAHTAIPIALYTGDWSSAETYLAEFLDHTTEHAMPVWEAVGRTLNGILMLQRGVADAPAFLRSALGDVAASGLRMRYPAYLGSLASGLCHLGFLDEALAAIDDALEWAERLEERWCAGELLRVKGEIVAATDPVPDAAEACFRQSISASRRRGILSFDLRASASLGRLLAQAGRNDDADQIVLDFASRFSQEHDEALLGAAFGQPEGKPAIIA